MVRMKLLILLLSILLLSIDLLAQPGRKQVLEGNQLFTEKKYDEANNKYRDALVNNPENPIIHFNIANTQYKKKKFAKETQFDMDANRLELSYGLQGILTPRSYIKGNILAITEKRVRGTNANVNFNEYKVNLTYANQFTSKYGIDIYAQLRDRKYKDHNDNFKSTREDIGGIGSVSFTMKLMPTLRLRLKTSYEYVNSNQDRFTYQKTIASAGLVKTF